MLLKKEYLVRLPHKGKHSLEDHCLESMTKKKKKHNRTGTRRYGEYYGESANSSVESERNSPEETNTAPLLV
jgi:hypothetical protein